MAKMRFLFIIIIVFSSTELFAQSSIQDDFKNFRAGNKSKFSTVGHPKSRGLNIQIEFPSSWIKKQGERPHIVQTFSSSEDGGIAKVATLSITPVPSELKNFSDKDIAENLFKPEFAESILPENSKLIVANPTKYDGESGILVYYVTQMSRSGANFASIVVSHRFLYQRHAVDFTIAYSMLITSTQKQISQQQSDSFLGLAIQMGNSIVLFDKYKVSLLNAEPMRLQSANTRFPVVIAFPIAPQTGQTPNPFLPNSMVYYFTAQDEEASVAYGVTIMNIPEKLGLISKDTARMMIDQSLDTQVANVDAALGVTGKVIETSTEPLAGYPSKYLEVVRQTTPRLFGSYRAVFVDRLLITVWATGLDTADSRSQAVTFVKSLRIDQ
jgi:hypothetical protein